MPLTTGAQKQQFNEEGYFILENAIPQHHLDLLRGECQTFIDQANAKMDAKRQLVEVADRLSHAKRSVTKASRGRKRSSERAQLS